MNNIKDINNEINNKIKKVFTGISTKDLKKNIKLLNYNIKNEYKQFGGLINLYILKELENICKLIEDPPVTSPPTTPPTTPLSYEEKVIKLFEFFNTKIKENENNKEIGYDKVSNKRKLLWLIDDLNELEIVNLTPSDPKDKAKKNDQIIIAIEKIYTFLTNQDVITSFEAQLLDSSYNDDEFKTYIDYFKQKISYLYKYITTTDVDEKNQLQDDVKKIVNNDLLTPNKSKFNLLASKRFNKFYKYSIKSGEDNRSAKSGDEFGNEDDDKDTILESRVFTLEENNYFKKTITEIIDFAKKKIGSENRDDKDKIISMLDKISGIDIKMNNVFNENVKMIKDQFKKNEYDDADRQKEYKKSRNNFIMNLVKLQNSLFQFQIRIIFTQITQINNIVNRRLLILEDDKNKFISKINDLLDIVNQKVTAMNEYLEATTDENKNIIPLTKEYKFNEYEYIIDPKTKNKEIILRSENVSADELTLPVRDVLKEINEMKNDPSFKFNRRFPDKITKKLINESEDPNYDKPYVENTDAFEDNKDKELLLKTDPDITSLDPLILKNSLTLTDVDKLLPILNSVSPGSNLVIDMAGGSTSLNMTGGVNIDSKGDLLTNISTNLTNISDQNTKNINTYLITNFYFINKLCLYIFNNNTIKKIMLLFLSPELLYDKLLSFFNNDNNKIFEFINCFFIKIISVNPNIDVLSIDNINKYIKHTKFFKQLNYLYFYIKGEYLYSNTLIYYNLINFLTEKTEFVNKKNLFDKIVKLRNIFYFIPYLLIDIKKMLYDNINYMNNQFLQFILVGYLDEILKKLIILNSLLNDINTNPNINNTLLSIIMDDFKIPLLVNLIQNISTDYNAETKDFYNNTMSITSKYNTPSIILKGYKIENDLTLQGSFTDKQLDNLSRYYIKNPKIIVNNETQAVSTNSEKIHKTDITYINYDDRLCTYSIPNIGKKFGDTQNYLVVDNVTKGPHPDVNFDFTASGSGIDDKLDVNKYSFGTFHNIYEINKNDILISNINDQRDVKDLENLHVIKDNIILIGLGISGSGKTTYLIGNKNMPGILIRYSNKMLTNSYKIQIKAVEIKAQYNGAMSSDELKKTTIDIDTVTDLDSKIEDIKKLLDNDRHVSVTPNNKNSSRSEMILYVRYYKDNSPEKYITLCDLAGNEIIFNNQLIYYIKNTYNKILELNDDKKNPDGTTRDENEYKIEEIKFDNIFKFKIQSDTSKKDLLIELIKNINETFEYINKYNKKFNNTVTDFSKTYTSKDFQDPTIEPDDLEQKNLLLIDDINNKIEKQLQTYTDFFINPQERLSWGNTLNIYPGIKASYSTIKELINYLIYNQNLFSLTDYKSELNAILELLYKLYDLKIQNVNDIEDKLFDDIIEIYTNTYASVKKTRDGTIPDIYIMSDFNSIKSNKKILYQDDDVNNKKKITCKKLIYFIIKLLILFKENPSSTDLSYNYIGDTTKYNKSISKINNLFYPLRYINDIQKSIYWMYFTYKLYSNSNASNIQNKLKTQYNVSFLNITIHGILNFDFQDFIKYNICIYSYILTTINILSYNLLLRKYEAIFINKFINDFKNDCSKLLKYQNVANYNNMKSNLVCKLSKITNTGILKLNDRNYNICLLPTTNLYLDDCNKNNSTYSEISHNVIKNFSLFDCDIFKKFYFDNGKYIMSKLNEEKVDIQEANELELIKLKKQLFNNKATILIETVINLFDWPQFNEFSIPYININKIKILFKIIQTFAENKLILVYKNKDLIGKIKKIINDNITELNNLLNKFQAYKGSQILNNIENIFKELDFDASKLDDSDLDMLDLTIKTKMNSINTYLKLIIIEINQMNNLTIINSIDTKNILENNELNYICSYKKYDSVELINTTFDSLETVIKIKDDADSTDTNIDINAIIDTLTKPDMDYINKLFESYTEQKTGDTIKINKKDIKLSELIKSDYYIASNNSKYSKEFPSE